MVPTAATLSALVRVTASAISRDTSAGAQFSGRPALSATSRSRSGVATGVGSASRHFRSLSTAGWPSTSHLRARLSHGWNVAGLSTSSFGHCFISHLRGLTA